MTLRAGYTPVDIPHERSDAMLDVDGWAFAGTVPAATVDELKSVIDWDRARGIEVTDAAIAPEGTLVACHSSFAYEMRVPGGGTVATSGLTWLGVHSGHRRRGLLTAMIDDHFARALARGEVVSTLFAAEAQIYQRFGYGLGAPTLYLNTGRGMDLREIPGSDDLRIEFANANMELHADVVREVLARCMRPGTHATVDDHLMRDIFIDPELWREGLERLRIAVVYDADGPAAFATFKRKLEWENGEPGGELTFWTWAAANAAAERRLFAVVSDLDLMSKVKARNIALDAPLVHLVKDIRSAHFSVRDNLWVRVLDLPRALAARTYVADADVTVAITDRQLPANDGLWRLHIENGEMTATKESGAAASADVSLSMQELSAAYLGGVTIVSLANAGLVTGMSDAVAALSAAFAGDKKAASALSF